MTKVDKVALHYAKLAEARSVPRNPYKNTLELVMASINKHKYQIGDFVQYLYGEDQTPEYGYIVKLPKSDGMFSISSGKLKFKIHQDQIIRKIVEI